MASRVRYSSAAALTILLSLLIPSIGLCSANQVPGEIRGASITHRAFGFAKSRPVEIYTLRNVSGLQARITSYGGIVTSLSVPDRNGKFADVVLGYDTLDEYLKSSPYFGALIGRYGSCQTGIHARYGSCVLGNGSWGDVALAKTGGVHQAAPWRRLRQPDISLQRLGIR